MMRLDHLGCCIAAGVAAFAVGGCVTEEIPLPAGPASFRVEVLSSDPFPVVPGCEGASQLGTDACPRPFPTPLTPAGLRIRATALAADGSELEWPPAGQNANVLVDVRPGRLLNVGADGLRVPVVSGKTGPIDLQIIYATGNTRVWIEDCGSQVEAGSFATGVSPNLHFDNPRIDQLNDSLDNARSPMEPRADNACVIGGDPRFGLGDTDGDGIIDGYAGFSHGGRVSSPPPPIGTFLEMEGCDRATYDANGGFCDRGPLLVTAISNDGFYVSDLNPTAQARGFNHIFAFNFNYPENLQEGDLLLSLRGSPMEFAGTTQIRNPSWTRDGVGRGKDLQPLPIHLLPDTYRGVLRSYGRNANYADRLDYPLYLELEKLEGALVCMDNLAPGSVLRNCDLNDSGRVERTGCGVDETGLPFPPLCCTPEEEQAGTRDCWGLIAAPPTCTSDTFHRSCVPLTQEELGACGLTAWIPGAPGEYCCERICYNDLDCVEESALIGFGQWTADAYGLYEAAQADPLKIALVTRHVSPDFDPVAFGLEQRSKPAAQRQHLRIIGNLRHVLSARPVWVIIARSPDDIAIQEEVGGCPQPPPTTP